MTVQVACQVGDLAPETARRVELSDANGRIVPVAVVRDADGGWHAISDICSHGEVSLSGGEV